MPGTQPVGRAGCQAPPPHAARIRTLFPGVATFNIVGPGDYADEKADESNNIEDGTLRRAALHVAFASVLI